MILDQYQVACPMCKNWKEHANVHRAKRHAWSWRKFKAESNTKKPHHFSGGLIANANQPDENPENRRRQWRESLQDARRQIFH